MGAAGIINEIKLPLVFHIHSTEKGRSRGMGSKTIEALEYKGTKISDVVIAVSEAMRSELQALGLNGEKMRVVHNGVNANVFRPERVNPEVIKRIKSHYGIEAETILFIGRLAQVKGIHNLVMAMPEILKVFPSAKLVVVGRGELDAQLKFIIEHMDLGDSVIMRNENLDEEGRILHYAIADVCAFPSVYDPSGVACIEAMSMAKPVVVGASGTTGMREIVENNGPERCGIHVNGSDPSDIANGIIEILNSERERKIMGRNSRNRVLNHFTWDRIAERMLEVYTEVCEMKNMDFIQKPKEPPEQKQYQLQLQ
jgi:glycosyltransferase involved in cell wall biosynthesis